MLTRGVPCSQRVSGLAAAVSDRVNEDGWVETSGPSSDAGATSTADSTEAATAAKHAEDTVSASAATPASVPVGAAAAAGGGNVDPMQA